MQPTQPKTSVNPGDGTDGIPINRTDGTDGIPINRTDGTDGAAMERTDGVKSVNPRDELAMQPNLQDTPLGNIQARRTGTLICNVSWIRLKR